MNDPPTFRPKTLPRTADAPQGSTPTPGRQAAPGVTIVVPVYNSAEHLGTLTRAIGEAMDDGALPGTGAAEVVFVNDASADSSWDEIVKLSARLPWVRGLDLATNVGQHAALIAGASVASGGIVVTMDDDLQHPPEEIHKLVAALRPRGPGGEAPVSLVYGTPLSRGPLGLRRTGSWVARWGLACRMRSRVALQSSAFRAFDAGHVPGLTSFDQRSINLDAALVALGARASSVRTTHGTSLRPASRYGIQSLVRAAGAVFMGPRTGRAPASDPAPQALQVRARVGFRPAPGPAPS